MRLSVSLTSYSWPQGPDTLRWSLLHAARRAEDAGVDTVWVADHLLQADPRSDPSEPMMEAYTTLGFLAAATEKVRLGTMVTWEAIRPPALLVKAVTTLDVLSGGRAWLGLGAGYRGDEAAAYGLAFPKTAERFERLEETVQLALRMWAGDDRPFAGRYHDLAHPVARPLPVSRPGPRLLIGGTGERRTLPLVARYADACNFFDVPDGGETLRRTLDALARACDAEGRNPADIETTVSTGFDPDEPASALVDRCAALAALGLDHAVLVTAGPWTDRHFDTVTAAIPEISGDDDG